ncbi:MAG: MATE family efflux transporter [Rhodospirillales bacterium]
MTDRVKAAGADAGVGDAPEQPSSVNWNRRVWRIAAPIMLANVSTPLLGIVDTAVIGQLPGAYYIGAVAVAAQIFTVVYWGFGFLRQGTSGFTAQSLGADNPDQVRAFYLRGLTLAAVIGLGLIVLQTPILWGALQIIGPSDQVGELAREYFLIRIWGAPATLAAYVTLGWFVGTQNARAALMIQVFVNGLNIVLDLVFVIGFEWGVPGVAAATLISEVVGAAVGIVMVYRYANRIGGRWRIDLVRHWSALRKMLSVNRDIMLRTLAMEVVFVSLAAIGARLGDDILAANALLLLLQTFMAAGLDAFADAAESLSGHAYGRRDPAQFTAAVRAAAIWGGVFALPFSVAYWLFGGFIIDFISVTPSVRELSREFLPWAALLPLISVWCFLLDGVYLGLSQARTMRNAMIISVAIYIAGVGFAVDALGNHGLWLAFSIFMAMRGVTLAWRFPALVALIDKGPQHLHAQAT